MPQFTGKSVVAVNQTAVRYYSAAHSSAQGQHNEIINAFGNSVCALASGCSIGVVCDSYMQSGSLLQTVGQINHSGFAIGAASPFQVWSVSDGAVQTVGIGSAYAYSRNCAAVCCLAYQILDRIGKQRKIFVKTVYK
jgi:hypothetical protein